MKIFKSSRARAAFDKLVALSDALEACGVESDIDIQDSCLVLTANIVNPWNKEVERLEVGAGAYSGYELETYITNESSIAEAIVKLGK